MNDSDQQLPEVVLRDIEPVLRQRLGDNVIVKNFTTKSLLPPGENYGSTILSVHVELKHKNTEKKEELHLIAKMCPPTEFQRRIFNSSRTFMKETFMYDSIMPTYNKLEIECGLKKNEIFEVLPKFYGSRLSLHPDGEFDDNAVILMENLKIEGYYTGDRSIGYDLEHSEIAVKALARFHALGMAMKEKKPGIFEVYKMHAKCLQVDGDTDNIFRLILQRIKDDPEINTYYDKCHKVLTGLKINELWAEFSREPWTSIIHSDFWVNNVMFHRSDNGKIDDVKFVDFQIYLYGSPVRDLIFFLYSSVDIEVTENQIEDLMDLYFESLVNTLKKMGCNTDAFNKEDYKTKMAEDAAREFMHLCFMLKVLTLDVKEINDFSYDKMQTVMVEYAGSKTFNERLRRLVLCFVNRNWL
ncbi:hypothetical protein WH47_01736 [Habropoda laboriosa]|uniref:CHK kinase-like domain-containing protein n=1 Tax=Habropoda laboriosa TaxID=597456 RepID=A0A0L7RJW6_9HYME|nr:PREDICTED: uncharacterized protein LOC108579115 [Habropoda laboriosa]KOC71093.1 hypothetical protein WH47_01736 [Habropoda laboriosa]